jgi:hypothetical protein
MRVLTTIEIIWLVGIVLVLLIATSGCATSDKQFLAKSYHNADHEELFICKEY